MKPATARALGETLVDNAARLVVAAPRGQGTPTTVGVAVLVCAPNCIATTSGAGKRNRYMVSVFARLKR